MWMSEGGGGGGGGCIYIMSGCGLGLRRFSVVQLAAVVVIRSTGKTFCRLSGGGCGGEM